MKQHITLLGSQPLPLYYVIKEYNPELVHLICTEQNKNIAQRIRQLLLPTVECQTYQVLAYSPKEVIQVCEEIHYRYSKDEFLYNLTGGTKIMSFAAYSVAMKYNAQLIYTTQSNEMIDMRFFNSSFMQCQVTNEEIFALQGQELDSYELLNEVDAERVSKALQIKQFIESYHFIYNNLGNFFRQNYSGNCNLLPSRFTMPGSIVFIKTENGFILRKDENELFRLEYPDALTLFFEGRWWEVLMANALLNWCKTFDKTFTLWQNVKFHAIEEKRIKNEVDILINIGTKILFVECKSGYVQQTDIYKIEAVRSTYGGSMSKAVLASYYPLKEHIKDKCRNQDISYFTPINLYVQRDLVKQAAQFFSKIVKQLNI